MGATRRYALLVGLTAGVALAGYMGYVLYPRFDLPAVTGASLLALAAAAGIASFFSPCSFPLAVTLLARETTPGQQGRLTRLTLWMGFGALLFLAVTGALIAAGAGAFFKQVTFTSTAGITIRVVVGSFLILLGLTQLNILPVSLLAVEDAAKPLLARQARLRRDRPALAFGLFGFAYLLAGFGWTGPILAGLATHAVTTGGPGAALAAFAVAGIVLVAMFVGLSLIVGSAQEHTLKRIQARTTEIKRWGGWILVGIGTWFLILAIWADFFAKIFPV